MFKKYFPNKTIKCNHMDLPWITDVIKSKLKEQFNLTKTCYKYGKRKFDLEKLIVKTSEWMENISAAKDKYIQQKCEKLKEPLTAKTYWKVINHFLSNKIPLLLVNGEIIPNSSQKYLCSKFFCFSVYSIANFKQSTYFLSENRGDTFVV